METYKYEIKMAAGLFLLYLVFSYFNIEIGKDMLKFIALLGIVVNLKFIGVQLTKKEDQK